MVVTKHDGEVQTLWCLLIPAYCNSSHICHYYQHIGAIRWFPWMHKQTNMELNLQLADRSRIKLDSGRHERLVEFQTKTRVLFNEFTVLKEFINE